MTLLLALPPDEDELELIDDSNVIQFESKRVKVQVEEELEVEEDEADIWARLEKMDKNIKDLHKACDETDKVFAEVMGEDHPLANTRAKRTVEKVKKARTNKAFADQLMEWKQHRPT